MYIQIHAVILIYQTFFKQGCKCICNHGNIVTNLPCRSCLTTVDAAIGSGVLYTVLLSIVLLRPSPVRNDVSSPSFRIVSDKQNLGLFILGKLKSNKSHIKDDFYEQSTCTHLVFVYKNYRWAEV